MTTNTFKRPLFLEDQATRLKPEITAFLDKGAARLQAGEDVEETIAMIVDNLQRMRRALPTRLWKEFATIECRRHPLIDLLHLDPLTLRSYTRLPGVSDADVLDFMFAGEAVYDSVDTGDNSEVGRRIFRATSNLEVSRAIRARRRVITKKLNELVLREPEPHVLSFQCGRLREATYCSGIRERRIGRYVAIDQDRENLAVVERELGACGVESVHASLNDLLSNRVFFAGFDFVYSIGAYNYLPDDRAQELTGLLFSLLNPGGRLLFTNFLPTLGDAGYMEAYMDWWLTYRTKAQLLQLAAALPDEQIEFIHCFTEDNGNVAFVEIGRVS
jgi:extracellular factor (EF) 3-hydroxypalmitic acid methyl ester biosynthesis protein